MLLYHVVLLLTTWPCVRADNPILEQDAVASANVDNLRKANSERTARGFGPIVVPDYQTSQPNADYDDYYTATKTKSENVLENEPLYSSEARILLDLPGLNANRRSFNDDSQYSDFELLKVNNDTPAIAHYQDSYDDGYSVAEESDSSEYKRPVRYKNRVTNAHNYHNNKHHSVSENKPKRTRNQGRTQGINENSQRINAQLQTDIGQGHFQPVVVVDPASYKVDLNFGSGTVTSKPGSVTPIQNNQNINPTTSRYLNVKSEDSTSRHYDNADDSKDLTYESTDYSEVSERSRKIQKSRRRPFSESSRKPPKDHRDEGSFETNESRKRPGYQRNKSRYRSRKRPNWNDDDRYDSEDESRENNSEKDQNSNTQSWSQADPNLNANNYQVNQIEKPKLVPIVPFNFVPVGNFDHASALGNSQGFDVSNAMLQSLVSGNTLVSTAAPLFSTAQPHIKNGHFSKHSNNFGIITSSPDIIVGQNSMQNPVQTVLIPQTKPHGGKSQLITNTVTPIYAVSTTTAPLLNGQGNTGKPLYAASTGTPVQQYAINQLLLPQSALQVFGLNQGTNNFQGQKSLNGNIIQVITPKTKDYVQGASLVPAFLRGNVNNQGQNSFGSIIVPKTKDQNAQIAKATNDAFENSMRQLQLQIQKNQALRVPDNYQNTDAIGSHSITNANVVNFIPGSNGNSEKAQLPNLGTKNVEIFNPNLKQNQIGVTFASPLGLVGQYPTAVLTTPVPLLSTTNFATVRPMLSSTDAAGLHGYVDSLTELGSKVNQGNNQNAFNPINFMPNLDVLKNQIYLNEKNNQDLVPQALNLVSSIPGGNFYKNNAGAQRELISKPRVTSDFEKYAEEMLRESVRTIQNTQKWNKDRRSPHNINLTDDSALARLKNELLRFKNSVRGRDKVRDVLEAHQTENKYHVVDPRPGKSVSDHRKPDFTMAKLEELLMNDYKMHTPASPEDIHVYHHHTPGRGHKDSSYSNDYKPQESGYEIHDYLTPPKLKSFLSKSPFYDKPLKKRPGRHHDSPRPKSAKTADVSASGSHEYGVAYENRPVRSFVGKAPRKRPSREFYPVLTTSYPSVETGRFSHDHKTKDTYDINHPRTHNLLGLLMKNPQLPHGAASSYARNNDDPNKFYEQGIRRKYSPSNEPATGLKKKSDSHQNPASLNPSNRHRVERKSYL